MGVSELNGGADVAGNQFAYRRAIPAIKQVDLTDPFGNTPCAVIQFHPGPDRAGIDAEKREFAEVLFVHRFKDL